MIPVYPESVPVDLALRPVLHPLFQEQQTKVSEFTFANIYLFREKHGYRLSSLPNGQPFFLGTDKGQRFFLMPFGLPEKEQLQDLLVREEMMKCVTREQAFLLADQGFCVEEDRDNFDYLYDRQDLADLNGRHYHKKRNLIKSFTSTYDCTVVPLDREHRRDALQVLEHWRENTQLIGDAASAREALTQLDALEFCGKVYLVEERPVAYVLGEFMLGGEVFVIHFEKADTRYKGLYQYINQHFAASLPESCLTINREQDLGDAGLRRAKGSYKFTGFVEKFRVFPLSSL